MSASVLVCALIGGAVATVIVNRRATVKRTSWATDAAAIHVLRDSGSAMDIPHDIEFFLYFPTETNAMSAAAKLEAQGYRRIQPIAINATSGKWAVIVMKTMQPDEEILEDLREELSILAAGENGEYDGWGAAHIEGD